MKSNCRITGKIENKFIKNSICHMKTDLMTNEYEGKIVFVVGVLNTINHVLEVKKIVIARDFTNENISKGFKVLDEVKSLLKRKDIK